MTTFSFGTFYPAEQVRAFALELYLHALAAIGDGTRSDGLFYVLDSVCLHDSGEFRVRFRIGKTATLRVGKALHEVGDQIGVYDFARYVENLPPRQTLDRMNERARRHAEDVQFLRGVCGTLNAALGRRRPARAGK